MSQLYDIKARLAAATPGHWAYKNAWSCHGVVTHESSDESGKGSLSKMVAICGEGAADAQLIANAPADLAYLLDQLDQAITGWKATIADSTAGGKLPASHIAHLACVAYHGDEITHGKLAELLGADRDGAMQRYMAWTQERGRTPVDVSPYVADEPAQQPCGIDGQASP